MSQLPWMGLGLSTNLGPADRPDPWRLHDRMPGLFDFVEYSAPLSIDEARREAARFATLERRRGELPAVFHPVHLNLWGPRLESAENLAALRDHLEAVGSPWVGNDVGWWHEGDVPFPGYLYVPPPLTPASLEACAAHARHVQGHVGVPLLLENPAFLFRNGTLHVLDFFAALHARTGLGLILDLGHLLSFQLAHGLQPETGLDGFPLEAVAEIHVAGGVVTRRGERGFYVDDHGQPVREELFALLERVLPRCTGLRAVTFEADGHPEPVAVATLRRLRALVPPRGEASVPTTPPAPLAVGSGPAPAADGADPAAWPLFALVHGGAVGPADDAAGLEAEVDFRLALLAQHLDRDWPLSRALCAPDRAALQAFATSNAYRSLFDGQGRSLAQVFATWARARVREARLQGGEVALAFEAWCHGLLARAGAATPQAGSVALAPGVAVGRFPVDLSELLFARKALRRHLADRAATSGLFESSGMEALQQLAIRAGQGPWAVAVRRVAGALEVEPLEAGLVGLLRRVGGGTPAEALDGEDREVLHRAIEAGLLRIA